MAIDVDTPKMETMYLVSQHHMHWLTLDNGLYCVALHTYRIVGRLGQYRWSVIKLSDIQMIQSNRRHSDLRSFVSQERERERENVCV